MHTQANKPGSRITASLILGSVFAATGATQTTAQTQSELDQVKDRLSELESKLEEAQDSQYSLGPYISEIGGRIQYDQTFEADAAQRLRDTAASGDELEEGQEFRRIWLFAEGAVAPWLDYKVQVDIAGGVSSRGVYLEAHDLGALPTILIGSIKEPLSLQEQTSSKYIALMSRSMLADEVGSVGYGSGVMLSDSYRDEKFNFSVGVFNPDFDSGDFETGDEGGDAWAVSSRITSPIIYGQGGDRVLHVGGFFSHRSVDSFSLGQEPEVHKTDDFISGAVEGLDNRRIFGAELAGVQGPAHFQAEYVRSTLNTDTGTDPDIDTYYVQGGFFLTGEHRPYSKGSGAFGRVKPNQPFTGPGSGPGAWELVARYSELDAEEMADASGFEGGLPGLSTPDSDNVAEMQVATAGLNWYPVSHAKWMLNYVYADQDALGDAHYVATRFQVDF